MKRAVLISTFHDVRDPYDPDHSFTLRTHLDMVHPFMYEEREYADRTEILAHHVHGQRIAQATHTITSNEKELLSFAMERAFEVVANKMERVIMEQFR